MADIEKAFKDKQEQRRLAWNANPANTRKTSQGIFRAPYPFPTELSNDQKAKMQNSMDRGTVSGREFMNFVETGVASPNLQRYGAHNAENDKNAQKAKNLINAAKFLNNKPDSSGEDKYRAEAMLVEADQLSKAKEYVPKTPQDLANDKKKAEDEAKKKADIRRAEILSKQADFYQKVADDAYNTPGMSESRFEEAKEKAKSLREESDKLKGLKNDLQSGGPPIAAAEVTANSQSLTNNARQTQEAIDQNDYFAGLSQRSEPNIANLHIGLQNPGQNPQSVSLNGVDDSQLANFQRQLEEQRRLNDIAKAEALNNKRRSEGLSPYPMEA